MNTNISSLLLERRLRRWDKIIPAFENNRSTGAELQGTDISCKARAVSCFFRSVQNFI